MDTLETATDRIAAAVARIEAAVEKSTNNGAESPRPAGEVRSLVAERDVLTGDLVAARAECDKLKGRTSDAAQRLSEAIGQLESILGDGG